MSLHRFHLPPEQCRGDSLRLDGREAHHALHVLRLRHGERVTVLDGVGGEFLCDVEKAGKDSLVLAVKEKKSHPAPPCPVALFVAIPKGKIIEDIIQKAVELGVSRIVPLLTERVVTHLDREGAEQKREKWQQVAVEAIKQCGAAWLPRVEAPVTLKEFLAAATTTEISPSSALRAPAPPSGERGFELENNYASSPRPSPPPGEEREKTRTGSSCTHSELPEFTLVGSLQTERRHPREWLREFQQQHGRLPQSAGVWIGPEGDFTLAELLAIEAAGARPVTLGRLTLRVETAAIYCLSFLNYELSA